MIDILWNKKIYQKNTQRDKEGEFKKTKMWNFIKKRIQSFGRLLMSE